ncbi:MAG: hypothetical protein IJR61_00515 [Clostridia bacterium]|nr:hypothetical protein [Clostridia bacterium]
MEQKFSGKRRNRRTRLTGEHLQPVARQSRFDEGKRSNRFERRKAKTCNLPSSLSCFDEGELHYHRYKFSTNRSKKWTTE